MLSKVLRTPNRSCIVLTTLLVVFVGTCLGSGNNSRSGSNASRSDGTNNSRSTSITKDPRAEKVARLHRYECGVISLDDMALLNLTYTYRIDQIKVNKYGITRSQVWNILESLAKDVEREEPELDLDEVVVITKSLKSYAGKGGNRSEVFGDSELLTKWVSAYPENKYNVIIVPWLVCNTKLVYDSKKLTFELNLLDQYPGIKEHFDLGLEMCRRCQEKTMIELFEGMSLGEILRIRNDAGNDLAAIKRDHNRVFECVPLEKKIKLLDAEIKKKLAAHQSALDNRGPDAVMRKRRYK